MAHGSTSEQIIGARVMGDITEEEFDRASDIALTVERQITCDVTGVVLDSRTAYGIYVRNPPRAEEGPWEFVGVVGGAFFDGTHGGSIERMNLQFGEQDKGWKMVTATDVFEKVDP